MPPVPQLGGEVPLFASKSTVNESPNLFQGALKDSGVANKPFPSEAAGASIFGKHTGESIFGKPTEPSTFMKPGESSVVFPKPAQKPDLLTSRSKGQDIFGGAKSATDNPFKERPSVENPFKERGNPAENPFKERQLFSGGPVKSEEKGSVFSRLTKKNVEGAGEKSKENPNPFRISRPIVTPAVPSYFTTEPEPEVPPKDELKAEPSKKLERLTSVEQLKAIKSIICEQVPTSAMNKKVLEKHFSRFGKVQKVVLFTKKSSVSVVFDTHQAAKKAKEKGHTISPHIPPIGAIFYKKVRKSVESEGEQPRVSKVSEITPAAVPVATSTKINTKELMDIMKSQAHSDADRYAILDARDKWMRARAPPKKGDVRLRGCCPDICPEKERYSRAIKNQLRIYEKMDGNVNHKSTLKEYSRSSADQEIPLLHELRPSVVLKTAMDHLLCNVIDRIEVDYGFMEEWYDNVENQTEDSQRIQSDNVTENIGEWFEYTWSTTRAMRKDITQQDLTKDPIAIDIMEKCARYHIVCAERLVEVTFHFCHKILFYHVFFTGR